MMDELCPQGWRADHVVSGVRRARGETPDRQRDWVALDGTAFEDESFRVAVIRRVWAPTINGRSKRWSPTVAPTRRSGTSSRMPAPTVLCGRTSESSRLSYGSRKQAQARAWRAAACRLGRLGESIASSLARVWSLP
jgi:hypothetical protein